MKIIHSLKVVHRDIKSGNVLYSNSLQKFIFCDFGLTNVVKEDIGYKTKMKFAGTYTFVTPELQNIYGSDE